MMYRTILVLALVSLVVMSVGTAAANAAISGQTVQVTKLGKSTR